MTTNRLIVRAGLWVPPILCMAVIFYLSSQSDPMPSVAPIVWDKLLHSSEYRCALAVLFYRAFTGEGAGWQISAVLALLATSFYGATDEWHQSFVPMRNSDLSDWFADTAGGAVAILLYGLIRLYIGRIYLDAHSLPD